MGVGGIGIWQLVIVLVIVLLLFGGKKLRNLGGDLGAGIRGFKKSMNDEASAKPEDPESLEQKTSGEVIDAEVTEKHKDKA